jgi:hypothetical protein
MDINQLRSQHPEVYATAVAAGAAAEKARITALLRIGKRFHAEAIAAEAIEAGTAVSDEALQLALLDRFSNWRDQEIHQEESDAAAAVVRGAKPSATSGARDAGDALADAMGLPPDPGPRLRL